MGHLLRQEAKAGGSLEKSDQGHGCDLALGKSEEGLRLSHFLSSGHSTNTRGLKDEGHLTHTFQWAQSKGGQP